MLLIQEDPMCSGAARPVHQSYWACGLELGNHNYWAHMPQLLKPHSLEPVLLNRRGQRNEKPHTETKSSSLSATREKPT